MTEFDPHLHIVESFWQQLSAIEAVRDQRARRGVARRRTARTLALAVLTLVVLAAVALAARAWLFGSPVPKPAPLPPRAGVLQPGSVRMLPIRVPDPDGGPPWAMQVSATSGGSGCVQVGRLVQGRLVALGIDGSFANDGKAHALPASSGNCGGVDEAGNLRAGASPSINTASAATDDPSCRLPGQLREDRLTVLADRERLRHPISIDTARVRRAFRAELRRALRRLAHPPRLCALSTLRTVIAGGVGPAARSVTLTVPGRRPITELLRAGDAGGYLFVVRGLKDRPRLTMSVRYSNGLACPLPNPYAAARPLGGPRACLRAPPGYVYSRKTH